MPISISRAWDESRDFLARERKLVLPILLALLVVPTALVDLVQPAAPAGGQPPVGPWMLLAFASLFFTLLGQLTMMRLALGWTGKVSDALRLAFQRIWIVIGAFLMLALIASLIVTPFIIIADQGAGTRLSGSEMAVSLVGIIFLFLIARFIPMSAIALLEKHGPLTLLRRSWALSRGNYWRLLGFFMVFLAGSLVLMLAVSKVAGLFFTLLLGPSEPLTVSRLLIALCAGVVQGLVQSVYAVMIARIAAQLVPSSGIPGAASAG